MVRVPVSRGSRRNGGPNEQSYCVTSRRSLCNRSAGRRLDRRGAEQSFRRRESGEVPRTPDGHPDLQGNWTNMTLTPFERAEDRGPVFTWEEVAAIERPTGQAEGCPANPGTVECGRVDNQGDASLSNESRLSGAEYNEVYWDRGTRVAIVDGEPRTSLVTRPSNGRRPPLTAEGRAAGSGVPRIDEPVWPIRPPGAETARRALRH